MMVELVSSLVGTYPHRVLPPHTAADMAHSTHSTQPALQPHRTTPRAEDKPPQTHRPYSNGLCSLLSEGPDPGWAQRHVNAGSPVQTTLIKKNYNKIKTKKIRAYHRSRVAVDTRRSSSSRTSRRGRVRELALPVPPVAPTASVAVARLVGMFATVMGVLSYRSIPVWPLHLQDIVLLRVRVRHKTSPYFEALFILHIAQ